MPVLVEAISVIIRRASIADRMRGGREAFLEVLPNSTLCADEELLRVGFMTPDDAGAFITRLEENGLIYLDANRKPQDICVADQVNGLTTPCDWIEFFRVDDFKSGAKVAACRLRGTSSWDVALPDNWQYETSISKHFGFVAGDANANSLRFLRRDGEVEVHLDATTGREVYIARAESGERKIVSDRGEIPPTSDTMAESTTGGRDFEDDFEILEVLDDDLNDGGESRLPGSEAEAISPHIAKRGWSTLTVRKARLALTAAILGYELLCGIYLSLGDSRPSIAEWLVNLLFANVAAVVAFYISLHVLAPPLPRRQRVPWMIVGFLVLLVFSGWQGGTRDSVIPVILTLGLPGLAAFLIAHTHATEGDVREFLEPAPPSVSQWTMEQLANWRYLEQSLLRAHPDGPRSHEDERRLAEARAQISRLEEEIWGSDDEG